MLMRHEIHRQAAFLPGQGCGETASHHMTRRWIAAMNKLTDQSQSIAPKRPSNAASAAQRPLHGRAAIVTGSSSGIGLAILTALVEAGANVVMNGFGEAAQLQAICQAIAGRHEVDAFYDAADLSKPAEIVGLVAAAERRFGRVDILVNNAR